jgi:hypothetical protein
MERIVSVTALAGHRLKVVFSDGTQGTVSLESRLFGPVFEPLRDEAIFAQARVDEFGAVCLPNGADLAPDALYRQVKAGTQAA